MAGAPGAGWLLGLGTVGGGGGRGMEGRKAPVVGEGRPDVEAAARSHRDHRSRRAVRRSKIMAFGGGGIRGREDGGEGEVMTAEMGDEHWLF